MPNHTEDGYTCYATAPIQPPGRVLILDRPYVRVIGNEIRLDNRGLLFEAYRSTPGLVTDPIAQVYVSVTRPGVVKGWHLHNMQTDRICCISGRIRLVVSGGPTHGFREIILDSRWTPGTTVIIPPGTAHGWINDGTEDAVVINAPDDIYDGRDEFRRPWDEGPWPGLPYDWHHPVNG